MFNTTIPSFQTRFLWRSSTWTLFSVLAWLCGCASHDESEAAGQIASSRQAEIKTAVTETSVTSQSAPPVTLSQEQWRKVMSETHLPKTGCFHASPPSTSWEEVPCATRPLNGESPLVSTAVSPLVSMAKSGYAGGGGGDFSAEVAGRIYWAGGQFLGVSNVSWEKDSSGKFNSYSLQLNSNFFYGPPICSSSPHPSPNCRGWEQFIYATSWGGVFIEYWLFDYDGINCPANPPPGPGTYQTPNWFWDAGGGGCRIDTVIAGVPSDQTVISNLSSLGLKGYAALYGDRDEVILNTPTGYSAYGGASVLNLSQYWNTVEFNIFGVPGGTDAQFNPESTLTGRILVQSNPPTTASPTCRQQGTTGETNNLNLVTSSCCPTGGSYPQITFMESNASSLPTARFCLLNDITPIQFILK